MRGFFPDNEVDGLFRMCAFACILQSRLSLCPRPVLDCESSPMLDLSINAVGFYDRKEILTLLLDQEHGILSASALNQ